MIPAPDFRRLDRPEVRLFVHGLETVLAAVADLAAAAGGTGPQPDESLAERAESAER